jgi:hypothetical protein
MKLDRFAFTVATLCACGGTTAGGPPPQGLEAGDASLTGDGGGGTVEAGPASTGSDASPPATVFPSIRHACALSPTGFVQSPPPPQGPSLEACLGSDQVLVPDAQIALPDGGPIVAGSSATLTAVISDRGSDGLGYPASASLPAGRA